MLLYYTIFILLFIAFISFILLCIRNYFITKKTLVLIKKENHEKWVYLTSFSYVPKIIKSAIWINPIRYRKFVKSQDYLNSSQIQHYVKLYNNNLTIILFFLTIIILINITLVILSFFYK